MDVLRRISVDPIPQTARLWLLIAFAKQRGVMGVLLNLPAGAENAREVHHSRILTDVWQF